MRLGIIGTGRIADRFVKTALMGNWGAEIVCVYNPHIESALKFAREHNIDAYTYRLEELADIADAVYIASPHETHYEYAKYMLNAGKNVLCEKPLALKRAEAEELYALANDMGVVLMEAVKTAYCPGFEALIQVALSGKIGRIADVEAAFTRLTPINTREYMAPVYNGSMLEFGSYVLLPIIRLMGTGYKAVNFKAIRSLNGVDAYTKVMLDYDEGMASGKMGLGVKSEGQLLISGTGGYILAESPWWMTKKFEVRYEDASKREVYNYPYESSGLQYEMKEFLHAVQNKRAKIVENADEKQQSTSKISEQRGVTPDESIAMADILERFLEWNVPKIRAVQEKLSEQEKAGSTVKAEVSAGEATGISGAEKLRIWAHRGCSYAYPENTLEAFQAAAELAGITGIELDVQLTKDSQIVVFHDENVRRVTDGSQNVADYTLKELKALKIDAGEGRVARIPTLSEVLELLKPYCKSKGLLINIELKTSVVRYQGIEEKTINMVKSYGLSDYIIYSSFLPESIQVVKAVDSTAKTGMLAYWIDECADGARKTNADALHPAVGGLVFALPDDMKGKPVRAWNMEEPFFSSKKPLGKCNLDKYKAFGATDIITNVPERYLK